MPGLPGWNHAVEQVIPHVHAGHDLLRPAQPHGVPGQVRGHGLAGPIEDLRPEVALAVQRPAAEPVAVKPDLLQALPALLAQGLVSAPLDDGEQLGLVFQSGGELIELGPAPGRPLDRQLYAAALGLGRVVGMGTHVQAHQDVRAVLHLGLDALFRGEDQLFGVLGGAKDDLPFPDFPVGRVLPDQGVQLKAPRIGEQRAGIAGKGVQAPQPLDQLGAGAVVQVVGVHHQAREPGVFHVLKAGGAHRAVGGVGKEGGQGHAAVAGLKDGHGRPPISPAPAGWRCGPGGFPPAPGAWR